jgi:hypothetical protein
VILIRPRFLRFLLNFSLDYQSISVSRSLSSTFLDRFVYVNPKVILDDNEYVKYEDIKMFEKSHVLTCQTSKTHLV